MMFLLSKALLGLGREDFIEKNITLNEPVVLPRIFHYPAPTQEQLESEKYWGIGEHTDYGVTNSISCFSKNQFVHFYRSLDDDSYQRSRTRSNESGD